jgi:hypothetical protein
MLRSARHPKHTRVMLTMSFVFMERAYETGATVPVAKIEDYSQIFFLIN